MNLKTTLALLVLVAAGIVLAVVGLHFPPLPGFPTRLAPRTTDLGTRQELASWEPDQLQQITIQAGDHQTVLQRDPQGVWTLPGKWPIRTAEVNALVNLLASLHSRFNPEPLPDIPVKRNEARAERRNIPVLQQYGFEKPGIEVVVVVNGKEHHLTFAEPHHSSERFERATYVQMDDKLETLQLPAGVFSQLSHPPDYYQQRRLFAGERISRDNAPQEKVERLAANKGASIQITRAGSETPEGLASKDGPVQLALRFDGDTWKLTRPAPDRPDPSALESLLTAVPDLWADRFVNPVSSRAMMISATLAGLGNGLEGGLASAAWLTAVQAPHSLLVLAPFGLAQPRETLTVATATGQPITLEIGASYQKTRKVRRPAMVGPMGIEMPAREETVSDELRYARLKGNDQVFEIKGDRLKDIFVSLDTLRDAHIARFKSDDVQRIQIKHQDQEIVLARDKDRWKLLQPIQADADRDRVNDLLSKLAGLEARGQSVTYDADPKETGLDKPATTIQLTLEEEVKKGSKDKEKKTRTITLQLGKQEGANLYVREVASPRVNSVEGSLAAIAGRDVLAWRGKRLFDFASRDLEQVTIQRGGEKVTLQQKDGKWKLAAPVSADADSTRTSQLANTLSNLEVVEYVDDAPTPQKLESQYGLAKPELTVTLELPDKTKSPSLEIGRARGPGNGYFAQLKGGNSVFAISNLVHDQLNRDSLAWRSKRILDLPDSGIERLTIHRGDQTITLQHKAGAWRLAAPTTAEVDSARVNQIASSIGKLEAEEFVTNQAAADQLGPQYGLDKPALSITVQPSDPDKPARTVQFGKARSGKPGLYARLAGSDAVFAVDSAVRDKLDVDPLTLLPKRLWQLPTSQITQVKVRKGSEEYTLERKDPAWQIIGPFTAPADAGRVAGLLQALASPHCDNYKAFEAKDLAAYGLDKPVLQVTLTEADGSTPARSVSEGTSDPRLRFGLVLGGPTGPGASSRYAKQINNPAIFVVNDALADSINHSAFDLLDPVLVQVEPGDLERVQVKKGTETLTLEKKGKDWQVLDAPASPFVADPGSIQRLEGLCQNVAGDRYVAYGPKVDLAQYGLDKPEATVLIRAKKPGSAETVERTLQLGKAADKDGSRYARLVNGPGVVVFDGRIVQELSRGYLDYVDRGVLKLDASAARSLRLEKGPEKVEVVKRDENWFLTKPADEKADDRAVQQFWGRLANLRAVRVAAYPPTDLKQFGLDMPAATVILGLSEDQKPASYTLKIGKAAEAGSGDHFAQLEGSKAVVVLGANVVRPLLAGALAFRDRTLVKFVSADVLRLERDRRKATFAQVDGTWKLTEPLKGDAEQDELDEFVNTLARLRADELVQEKPTPDDLKKYGLDRPTVRWQVLSGDRLLLDLQIGAAEKDGSRRYAQIAGKDLVVLLDPRLSARALGEFRPRAVWGAPLDAAQIDAVRFGYQKDPFTLERSGGVWQVKDRTEVPIVEVVNETLAALAGLKLERYVVDKDADLQLYGLKPPELILEVPTRTGKRVLQIGSREGESQRRYAHVAEPGRTDVFLLSEADAGKLMRDLSAFSKGKP